MPQSSSIALSPMSISLQLCRPARVLPQRSWLMRIGRHSHRYRPMSMRVSAGVDVSTVRCAWLSLVSSLAAGLAGRAKEDGGVGGWWTRPAKAANGCLPWILAGGHRALLTRIGRFGTPIYSLWSNRANLGCVDIYQKYNHFVNIFHRNAF